MLMITDRTNTTDSSHYYLMNIDKNTGHVMRRLRVGPWRINRTSIYYFYRKIKRTSTTNLSNEQYCWLIRLFEDVEYSNLKTSVDFPNDKSVRLIASSLLAKALNKLSVMWLNTRQSHNKSRTTVQANINIFNSHLSAVNMLLLFPNYTLFLLKEYATSSKGNNCREPGIDSRSNDQSNIKSFISTDLVQAGSATTGKISNNSQLERSTYPVNINYQKNNTNNELLAALNSSAFTSM